MVQVGTSPHTSGVMFQWVSTIKVGCRLGQPKTVTAAVVVVTTTAATTAAVAVVIDNSSINCNSSGSSSINIFSKRRSLSKNFGTIIC